MNVNKVFANALKHHYKGEDVTIIAYHGEAKELAKKFIALPEMQIKNFELYDPEWKYSPYAFLLSITSNNEVWCMPSVLDGSEIKSEGYVIVDEFIENPEQFGVSGSSVIKVAKS